MGNYKFRFSDMTPNAWFYKLKDMGKRVKSSSKRKNHPPPSIITPPPLHTAPPASAKPAQTHRSHSRRSYHIPTADRLYNSPEKISQPSENPQRKSMKQKGGRRGANLSSTASPKLVTSSVVANSRCRTRFQFDDPPMESLPETELRYDDALLSGSFDRMVSLTRTSDKDIVINVDKDSLSKGCNDGEGTETFISYELPPIVTTKKHGKSRRSYGKKQGPVETDENIGASRRISTSSHSPGMRLRMNSPKIANRRIQAHAARKSASSRRSLSESFAVVKASLDPYKDFKESMVEMIMENNIRTSKDMEDLLACYLALNSDEYHDIIIKVFKEIWVDLINIEY